MKYISWMIILWNLALTLQALFGAHTLAVSDIISGLIMGWALALLFVFGAIMSISPISNKFKIKEVAPLSRTTLLLLSFGSIAFSIFLIRFYTGNTITDIIFSITQQQSLYRKYQAFFREQELWRLTLNKIPAVFFAMLLKLSLVLTFIQIVALRKRPSLSEIITLVVVSFSYIMFSIARGTSFELFELFILLWFSLSIRTIFIAKIYNSSNNFAIPLLLATALTFAYLYDYNNNARFKFNYDRYCITEQICKDPDALIYLVSQFLGDLSFKLSAYFTFGIFFSSSFIDSILLSSSHSALLGMLPFGYTVSGDIRGLVCNSLIDCGSAWVPDFMILLQYLGGTGLICLIFMLGRTANKLIQSNINRNISLPSIATLYFIVLLMFSLPVGSFVFVSSSNTLTLFVVFVLYIYERLRSRPIRKKVTSVTLPSHAVHKATKIKVAKAI